jgi:hypothetical protein
MPSLAHCTETAYSRLGTLIERDVQFDQTAVSTDTRFREIRLYHGSVTLCLKRQRLYAPMQNHVHNFHHWQSVQTAALLLSMKMIIDSPLLA